MWAEVAQSRKNFEFLVYKFPKRVYPLKRFLQNLAWRGSSRSSPHAKFYRYGLINVGLRSRKSPKMVILGINFPPKGYIPLSDFLNKILPGGGSSGPHPHWSNIIRVSPRILYPLKRFLQNSARGESPRTAPSSQTSSL